MQMYSLCGCPSVQPFVLCTLTRLAPFSACRVSVFVNAKDDPNKRNKLISPQQPLAVYQCDKGVSPRKWWPAVDSQGMFNGWEGREGPWGTRSSGGKGVPCLLAGPPEGLWEMYLGGRHKTCSGADVVVPFSLCQHCMFSPTPPYPCHRSWIRSFHLPLPPLDPPQRLSNGPSPRRSSGTGSRWATRGRRVRAPLSSGWRRSPTRGGQSLGAQGRTG